MNVLQVDKDYNVVKIGKVSKHTTKAKGRIYNRGKIYLPDAKFIDKTYFMVELDEIISGPGLPKRKGYLITIMA
jgi:hypothetical protein